MKKLLVAVLLVVVCAGVVFAETHNVGVIIKNNMTEQEYKDYVLARGKAGKTKLFSAGAGNSEDINVKYYDSLMMMQLALDRGDIEEMVLPEVVAEHILNTIDDKYTVSMIIRDTPMALAFGFKNDNAELRDLFNEALTSMKQDGTLGNLVARYIYYIYGAEFDEAAPVNFRKIDGAKTLRIAVTGDMPPIDFIDAGGVPGGFNVAVIAEIARRLGMNVELVNIESSARVSSLMSGRSDAVFWFEFYKDADTKQPDVPENVLLSSEYFDWNKDYCLQLVK